MKSCYSLDFAHVICLDFDSNYNKKMQHYKTNIYQKKPTSYLHATSQICMGIG